MPQVVARQEVREQLPICEHRVDRLAKKTGVTTESTNRVAVRWKVLSDPNIFGFKHRRLHVYGIEAQYTKRFNPDSKAMFRYLSTIAL
jgi:hypothetical protein